MDLRVLSRKPRILILVSQEEREKNISGTSVSDCLRIPLFEGAKSFNFSSNGRFLLAYIDAIF